MGTKSKFSWQIRQYFALCYLSVHLSLANNCPNKVKEEQSRHVKITLFTQDIHKCYIEKFVGETSNCAVLDSGCTKNVCGKAWLDSYLNTLTERDAQKVLEESPSSSKAMKKGDVKIDFARDKVSFLNQNIDSFHFQRSLCYTH